MPHAGVAENGVIVVAVEQRAPAAATEKNQEPATNMVKTMTTINFRRILPTS